MFLVFNLYVLMIIVGSHVGELWFLKLCRKAHTLSEVSSTNISLPITQKIENLNCSFGDSR